jgi:N,N'-diacetyllegionaminate synthase
MYKIIEVANTHSGDFAYLETLIDEFSCLTEGVGIKFQPFKYDCIAAADFEWYPVYKKLYFSPEQWKTAINKAATTKDVWLDIFDTYGIEILHQNMDAVSGIKLQSSVLFNLEVLDALATLDLSTKRLIINVAGRTIDDIDGLVARFRSRYRVKELWLEVGFQSYPTKLEDTGVNKIGVLMQRYGLPIVFADHVNGRSPDALWLPVIAAAHGASVIEKHVMLEGATTEYDHFSSIYPSEFKALSERLSMYASLDAQPFVNEREIAYLTKSDMIPLLVKDKLQGQAVGACDVTFKRSAKTGLTASALGVMLSAPMVTTRTLSAGDALQTMDFKPAKVAVIIACRLKSSRLKSKALLEIGGLPSVQFCIKNALGFKSVDDVILATSTEEQDAPLCEHTYSKNVVFHRGHPDDVIQRYVDVVNSRGIDIVVRVTADMPFIDDEVLQFLIRAHINSGADYTTAIKAAVGTNLEIINAEALKRVKSYFPSADYSEYMTWYFQNNPEYFALNIVDLPPQLVRPYRLTLDHQEDLDMFNRIHKDMVSSKGHDYRLRDVLDYLDANPDVASMNSHLSLKYRTDKDLIALLDKETKIYFAHK